jgi:bacteriocin biosynthesis cyclodehydratase domain-containing protein
MLTATDDTLTRPGPGSLAQARPRVKQDVLFTETPYGVLFHNADAGFQLTAKSAYRLACLLMPYLSGEHTVADLCAGLSEDQGRMVEQLVTAMFERGFARDVATDEADDTCPPAVLAHFQSQVNYIDHFVDRPQQRFADFRTARVAVLGDDAVATWCGLSLVRNGAATLATRSAIDASQPAGRELEKELAVLAAQGCPVRLVGVGTPGGPVTWSDLAGYDVVVVSAVTGGARQLLDLITAGVPEGVTLLSAALFGDQVVVGPMMRAGTAGCWMCAALRFGANDQTGAAAGIWSRLHAPRAEPTALHRPLAAMLGNLLAYEVFRIRTGAMPAETDGQVIIQNRESLDVVTEPLLAHPDCPQCTVPTGDPFADARPESPSRSSVAALDQGDTLITELNQAGRIVHRTVGVFTGYVDEECTQVPLKVGRLTFGLDPRTRRTVSAFDVHHAVGARLSAVHRAAEVYAERSLPLRIDDGPTARIDPATLHIASGTGIGASDIRAWTRATSLVTGQARLVPAAAVQSFGAYNIDGVCVPTSAGTAAAGTAGQALGRGLLGALGYEALDRAVRGRRPVARVPVSAVDDDAELRFLIRTAVNLDLTVELLDLSDPTGGFVLLARTSDGPLWALGSDISWRQAALVALRDLLGTVQLGRDLAADDPVDNGDPILRALDPFSLAVTGDRAAAPDGQVEVDLAAAIGWDELLVRIAGSGRDALAVPRPAADLARGGIFAARVLLVAQAEQ